MLKTDGGISFQIKLDAGDARRCMKSLQDVTKKYTFLKNNFLEFSKLGFLELYADSIMTSGMRSFPGPGLPDRALWQSFYLQGCL